MRAQVSLLADGRRLHMNDGPIDIILGGFGMADEIRKAYTAAARRFTSVLDELCAELPLLRRPVTWNSPVPSGRIARRMREAVMPFAEDCFITPMAAVAGAVAEEILSAMIEAAKLDRAYVNDGGDIAIYLAAGQQFTVGMVERPDQPSLFGTATLNSTEAVRGIATSGWRGRSFSLGIADAVTVLAESAAAADAAATLIANAVDLPGHPHVVRVRANELDLDSDLGARLVTQHVGKLTNDDIQVALDTGVVFAESLANRGLIHSTALNLGGHTRIVANVLDDRSLAHA